MSLQESLRCQCKLIRLLFAIDMLSNYDESIDSCFPKEQKCRGFYLPCTPYCSWELQSIRKTVEQMREGEPDGNKGTEKSTKRFSAEGWMLYISETMILSICSQVLWCLFHVATFFSNKSRLTMQSMKTRDILRIVQLRCMTIKWLAKVTQKARRDSGTGVPKAKFSILARSSPCITPLSWCFRVLTGGGIRTDQKAVSLLLPKHITETERDIYFPNTTWRRCLDHSKGEWEGGSVKAEICKAGEMEEERKKDAKMSKGKGLMRRKLVVAVGE